MENKDEIRENAWWHRAEYRSYWHEPGDDLITQNY